MTDWIQPKQFACSLVDSVQRSRPKEDSRRSLQYYLKMGDDRWKVCKSMFCGTLGIPQRTVLHWMDDANHGMPTSPLYSPPHKRRPTEPSTKRKMLAKEYLNKINKVPSHYCRKSTTKTYVYPGDFFSFANLHHTYVNWLAMSYPEEKPLSLTVLKASRLPPPPLYSCPLPIPARIFNDLQELKTVLNPDHHPFYDSLPHN